MSLGFRVTVMRSIMGVLAPLTGQRATGTALVRATGSDVVLPRGCFAAPIVESDTGNKAIARDKLLFTTAETTVTAGGTAVPVASLVGGARHNFAAGTDLRWDPQLAGVEIVSSLNVATTGGAEPTGDAKLRGLIPYEELATNKIGGAIFAAKLQGLTPGVVVTWAGTGAAERMGRNVWQRSDRWILYLVVTRKQGTVERGHEGLNLLDLLEAYLGERGAVDGRNFSDPGVSIVGASRHSVTPSSYVYALTIETHGGMKRIDTRLVDGTAHGVIADWDRSRYDVNVATTPEYPLIVDARYDQDP